MIIHIYMYGEAICPMKVMLEGYIDTILLMVSFQLLYMQTKQSIILLPF